jgi:hypothetical protein
MLADYLRRMGDAQTEEGGRQALDTIASLIRQGFETQEERWDDLRRIEGINRRAVEDQLQEAISQLRAEHGELEPRLDEIEGHLTELAEAISRLLSAQAVQKRLPSLKPLGFRVLENHLFADGGGGTQAERAKRLMPELMRSQGPTWVDFREQVPFRRKEVDELLAYFADDASAGGIAFLQGETASGKSVMALYTGYLLTARGHAVYWANLVDLVGTEALTLSDIRGLFESLDGAFREIDGSASFASQPREALPRPVFIIEDLHRIGRSNAVRFTEMLNEHVPMNAAFILTTRPIGKPRSAEQGPLDGIDSVERRSETPVTIWDEARARSRRTRAWLLGREDTATDQYEAVALHAWQKRWELADEDLPFPLGTKRLKQISNVAGGNLWTMTWMLSGHDGNPDTDFTQELALESALAHLRGVASRTGLNSFENTYAGKPLLPAILLIIGVFSRWELGIDRQFVVDTMAAAEPGLLGQKDWFKLLNQLVESGELVAGRGQKISLPHSALADICLLASQKSGIEEYLIQACDSYLSSLPASTSQAIMAIADAVFRRRIPIASWRLNQLEAMLLATALMTDRDAIELALFADSAAAHGGRMAAVEADGALRANLILALLRGAARFTSNATHNCIHELKSAVREGEVTSSEIISAADEMSSSGIPRADLLKAVSFASMADEQTVDWFEQQWRDSRQGEENSVEVQAACALLSRGRIREEILRTIDEALASGYVPDPVLRTVRRLALPRWVLPLRALLSQPEDREAIPWILRAWAEQSRAHDPDDIAEELMRYREPPLSRHVLMGGDILPRIDSPLVVKYLIDQLPTGKPWEHYYAPSRLNDIWLPRAVGGFEGAAAALDADGCEVLHSIITTILPPEEEKRSTRSFNRKDACEAAARLQLPQLDSWLGEALDAVKAWEQARHFVQLAGWWQAPEAAEPLVRMLEKTNVDDWIRQSIIDALGDIGGSRCLRGILENQVRHEEGWAPDVTGQCEAAATADVGAAREAIRFLRVAGAESVFKIPAAAALNKWSWRDLYDRECSGSTAEHISAEIRDAILDVLESDQRLHERAAVLLINALAALPASDKTALLLQEKAAGDSEDVRASAILSAVALDQDRADQWLDLVEQVDEDQLGYVRYGVLAAAVKTVLGFNTELVGGLSHRRLRITAYRLAEWGALRELSEIAAMRPVPVRLECERYLNEWTPPNRSCRRAIASAICFAGGAFAECLSDPEAARWPETTLLDVIAATRVVLDSSVPMADGVSGALTSLLCRVLVHGKVRVRDATARLLSELDGSVFADRLSELSNGPHWQDRAAAAEASWLLPDAIEADILAEAEMDVDDRVRNAAFWARERSLESEAARTAVMRISQSTDVRGAFRWGAAIVRAGDDKVTHEITRVGREIERAPAMRSWLKHLVEQAETSWEKRTRDHDNRVPGFEPPIPSMVMISR